MRGVTRPKPISVFHSVIIAMKCLRPETGARPGVVRLSTTEPVSRWQHRTTPRTATTAGHTQTHDVYHRQQQKRNVNGIFVSLGRLSQYGAKCLDEEEKRKKNSRNSFKNGWNIVQKCLFFQPTTTGDTNMMAHSFVLGLPSSHCPVSLYFIWQEV